MTAGPSTQPERKPRWGDEFDVRFARLDARGNAVGECGPYTASERGGALGSLARVQVLSRRRDSLDVRTLHLIERGADFVPARCAHHGTCGGCTFQDLAYAAQLRAKAALARETFRRAGFDAPFDALVPAPEPWHYRNKMDFTFGPRRWTEAPDESSEDGAPALGLHPRGIHSKVLEIGQCAIAFEGADRIVASARKLAREQGLDAYDTRVHAGWLRHLVLRRSCASGEVLTALVTTDESPQRARAFADALLAAHPEIATVVQLLNGGRSLVAVGERELVLHGRGAIRERLGGHDFELRAQTFFQVNTPAAERLLALVLAAADVRPGDVVHDLYCGVGALTLALAGKGSGAAEAVGFELVESAVLAAHEAALANRVANAHFVAGDVLSTWRAHAGQTPDVIVADPPRAGLHPKLLDALAASAARRIVLVACELRSGARDGALLASRGWRLARADAVDLFPHTPHLECVLAFERVP